jgi:hypothetical protein
VKQVSTVLKIHIIFIFCVLFSVSSCSVLLAQDFEKDKISYISWEEQSWKTGGSSEKLEVTKDGYNYYSCKYPKALPDYDEAKLTKVGWEIRNDIESGREYIYLFILSSEETKIIFNELLDAGITKLNPIEANYCDGGGVVIGLKSGYISIEKTIAYLAYKEDSEEYKIFKKCKSIVNIERFRKMFCKPLSK